MPQIVSQNLDNAKLEVQDLLKSFAESGGFSPEILAPAFGSDVNAEELQRLSQQFAQRDFSSWPGIEIRSGAELGGARGVYVLDQDKIYLARELIESAASQEIVALLLEEIGHGIDARINTTDSAGDEGAIFSALLRGEDLSAAALAALHQEDDTVELVIDGETLTGEANTLTVNTLTDVVNATDGVTSLREALVSAVSGDTITFAKSLRGGIITLGGSQLEITKSLTIDGDINDDGVGDITIDGNGESRVLLVDDGNNDSSRNVFLDGLTIFGGTVTSSTGGGISNSEFLSISNSTVSRNSAEYGGGIDNHGTLTITNSIINGNSANYYGGGIYNDGTLTITSSAISSNSANHQGGGIYNNSTLTITSSTISGNSTNNHGGGINNYSTLTITNSTISGNSADEGGGIINKLYSTTSLESTIVADNTAGTGTPDIFNDGSSITVTASNSLIENGTITQDLGNNITGQDPLLDPNGLQDNGGPTQTIALQENSPAINAGSNPLGLTTDQRGEGRTIGGGTDIGAYEVEPPFGEYGTLNNLNHDWQTITLNESYTNPVVIVGDPTLNGPDPAVVRLRNVDSNSFQLRIQEANYLNDRHAPESVSYLVLEAGDWILSDGTRISAGTHDSNRLTSSGFDSINLTGFDSPPTVLSQVQTFNESDWVTTRTQGQSSSSFQVALQEEEARNGGSHAVETIGWLAIDQGVANNGDTLLEGGTTGRAYTHSRSTVSFSQEFDSTPSVIAKLGSYYGADTANLRLDRITNSGFGVRVYEEKSLDSEINHTTESISFLALEGDSGFLTL